MPVESLLFPTKFRPGALQFLKKLLVLKKAGLRRVHILHVIDRDKVSFDYAGYLKELEEKLRSEAEAILSEWKEELSKEVEVETSIVVGIPEYEVLEAEKKADLVAMGKPTSGIIKRLFMGSTTLNILAHSTKPAIMAKYEDDVIHGDRCLFCKVAFATDGSEPCRRALNFLLELAPVIQEVDVISVANLKRKEDTAFYEPILEEFASPLKEAGLRVSTHLLTGTPSKEIIKFAEAVGSSMIVVGTTGKDAIEEMIIGSASHRILEKAKVPVMVVP